jgi:2'-5' RNA ligase
VRAQARARLFAALDLPGPVRGELAGWSRRARCGNAAVRLVDSEMLHVTLCFLGWRSLEEVPALGKALADAARSVAGLGLGAPLWLPPRRPRVLAVEVHDELGELGGLQGDVARAVSAAVDWEQEKRRYRPHVTVARMREGAAPRERELEPTPALGFSGEAVTLYRSWLAPAGATYESLERVALGRETDP